MFTSGIESIADSVPKYNSNKTNQIANTAFDTASGIASSIDPLVGGALKVFGAGYDILNNISGGAFSVDNKEKSALGTIDNVLGSKFFAFSPAGLANTLTKTKVKGSDTDITKDINLGYTPSREIKSSEYGGISRLFGKKSINRRRENVEKTNYENALKRNIISDSKKNLLSARNTSGLIANKNYVTQTGGLTPTKLRTLVAKKGVKLSDLKNIKNIVKAKKGSKLPEIDNSPKNVIPDGALHARKNNMTQFGNNITHKGIPVVSGDLIENEGKIELKKGGEITQTAEIEREEIIFHKELTDKIEELNNKYKETEDKNILLEVGKLVAHEILENTDDNVGLINKVK
jgi:hypothetical protein